MFRHLLITLITVLAFTASFGQFARLQVIHNAADPGADSVDVYLDGALLLDNFGFRQATPYIDAPANVAIKVGIAPANSSSAADTIANFDLTLTAGETYVAVANGVLTPGSFDPNPDARSTAFTLFIKAGAREQAADSTKVEFFALHGATDAPTVDVIARGVGTLVDDAAYGDITGYIPVPAAAYTLDVTPGSDNATIVASFDADLSGLAGGAAVVFASGFLSPATNNNGEAFGLFAALPNGTVVPFTPILTDVREENVLPGGYSLSQNYPNPFNPQTKITYSVPVTGRVVLKLYDLAGREVKTLLEESRTAGVYSLTVDGSDLPSGVYFYSIRANEYTASKKMSLIK
jgi:hypothetical protein